MPLFKASVAEIIRAKQKDDELISTRLHNLVKEALRSLFRLHTEFAQDHTNESTFGQQFRIQPWVNWTTEIEMLTSLVYFFLTTGVGNQTFGEEYVNIVQVDASGRQHPGWQNRLFMVLCHILTPYVVTKMVDKSKSLVNNQEWILESRKTFLIQQLDKVGSVFEWFYKLHRSIFLITASSDSIAKAITSIGHVTIRQRLPPVYRAFIVLGYLGLLESLLSLCYKALSLRRTILLSRNETSAQCQDRKQTISQHRCPLCYEQFDAITSTICGHLFCWKCVYPWCCAEPICPICRESCKPSQLVLLANYSL